MDREIVSVGRQAWTLTFAIAIGVCVVKGDYVVMVRTHSFSNPGSLLANQDCCDFQSGGGCRVPGCDNRFVHCLRRNANSSDENCRVSQTNWNDAPLNFSEPMVLGLPNPLPLQGLAREWNATKGVYFHLEVIDLDLNSGEEVVIGGWIIRIIRHLQLQVGEETRMFTFRYIDPTQARITLSFRVVCAENYYRPDCSQFCVDNCTCDPGFTGEFCQSNIDDCVGVNCGNGVCVDGINSFTCNCNTGYTGILCDVDIDECLSNPCGTNGKCMNQEGVFNCSCDPGFTGDFCQTDINECMEVNCNGNGVCLEGINSFTCSCIPGYTGTLCDLDIDECSSNPCGINSQCENQEGTFNCTCDPGFTGELCQTNIDDCVGVNCSGNGVCVDGVDSFTCQCRPGFSGTLCSEVVELGSSRSLVVIVGGAVGGVLVIITFLVLVIVLLLIFVKCKTRPERMASIDNTLVEDIEMKENEVYGVSMATVQPGRPQTQDGTLMSRNVCYATAQHMEIVDNECYDSVPEKHSTLNILL